MQYFVYIGRDSKTIELLSRLSIGVFYAASNCSKAVKVLEKIREKYDAALFFEQVNLSQDIADIQYMRKKYPGLYFIGEVLDIDGDTGGYNLQFAYSSARAAADSIYKK